MIVPGDISNVSAQGRVAILLRSCTRVWSSMRVPISLGSALSGSWGSVDTPVLAPVSPGMTGDPEKTVGAIELIPVENILPKGFTINPGVSVDSVVHSKMRLSARSVTILSSVA